MTLRTVVDEWGCEYDEFVYSGDANSFLQAQDAYEILCSTKLCWSPRDSTAKGALRFVSLLLVDYSSLVEV